MHDWHHRDPVAWRSDDVRQHQQDHHDQRHPKQPKNDRHTHPPTFTSGSIALPNNARLATKFQRRPLLHLAGAHAFPGRRVGQVPAMAICCIAFSLLQAPPRTADRSRKSNGAGCRNKWIKKEARHIGRTSFDRYVQTRSALLFALPGLLRLLLATLVTPAALLLSALVVCATLLAGLSARVVVPAVLLSALSGIAFRWRATRIIRIVHRVLLGVFSLPWKERPPFGIVPRVGRAMPRVNSRAPICNQRQRFRHSDS
jgi:hypothetical protein